jgi:hypothetical protein
MCWIRTLSACRDIDRPRLGEHLLAEIAAQTLRGVEIDASAQQSPELVLDREERQAVLHATPKLDEQINIARIGKIVPQSRPKDGQTDNAAATADRLQFIHRYPGEIERHTAFYGYSCRVGRISASLKCTCDGWLTTNATSLAISCGISMGPNFSTIDWYHAVV